MLNLTSAKCTQTPRFLNPALTNPNLPIFQHGDILRPSQ
jgi:hypothetical protein